MSRLQIHLHTLSAKQPTHQLTLERKIYGPKGELLSHQKHPSQSWLRNQVYWQNYGWITGVVNLIQINSVPTNLTTPYQLNVQAPEGSWKHGITLGSNAAALNIQQYNMQTSIQHGITAGKLYFYVTTVAILDESPTSITIVISRLFANQSASIVTIRECGLGGINAGTEYMLVRDLISPDDVIPIAGLYQIIYKSKYSV